MKTLGMVGIGRLTSPYFAAEGGQIARRVEWLKQIPRDAFQQDLLYSLGATGTVCVISRNDALARVEALIATGTNPGYGAVPTPQKTTTARAEKLTEEAADQPINLVEIARDKIEKRLASPPRSRRSEQRSPRLAASPERRR